MQAIVAYSKKVDIESAIIEIVSNFKKPKFVLFFAPLAVFEKATSFFQKYLPGCTTIGTNTYYTYTSLKVISNAISAVSFEDGISVSAGIVEEINKYPSKYIGRVKASASKIPNKNTLCLEFMTSFSLNESVVVNMLNSVCSKYKIPVVGANAGTNIDDIQKSDAPLTTYVSLNGKVYLNSCVFAFIHNENGRIGLFREDIFQPTNQSFTVTSIDYEKQIIYTLDNMPAVIALAKSYRCNPKDVSLLLRSYPFGRVTAKKNYLTDIIKINSDGSFFANNSVFNNTKTHIFKASNYKKTTKNTIANIKHKIPNPSFILIINSLTRALFYQQEQYLNEWTIEWNSNFNCSLGISSCGEQFLNNHLNQLGSAIVFE